MLQTFTHIAAMGVGATAIMDLWALLLKRGFGVRGTDYGLVGRWAGYLARGRVPDGPIAAADPIRGERALGGAVHYGVGLVFAAILALAAGPEWLERPTLVPALMFGAVSVAAPFLILQPALGLGFFASRAPRPWTARLRSLMNHLVFGAGLYLSALALTALLP